MRYAKYNAVPTEDPDSVTVDFSSPFTYSSTTDLLGGNHGNKSKSSRPGSQYHSVFTYSEFNRKVAEQKQEPVKQSIFIRCCTVMVTLVCYLVLLLTFPISVWFTFKTVQQFERMVVFRLGRMLATKGPGMVVVIPFIDRYYMVDMRTKAFSVPPQKIFTTDGAIIEVGADVYYSVVDPVVSVTSVQDLNHSCRDMSQALLVNELNRHASQEVDCDRSSINEELKKNINEITVMWGVKVDRMEMSQVKILQQGNPMMINGTNPLNLLGPILFPPGDMNSPVQQLQQAARMSLPQTAVVPGKHQVSQLSIQEAEGADGGASQISPQDILDIAVPHLTETLVQEVDTTYKFCIHGDEGGVYYLDLKHGTGAAGVGEPPGGAADVTFSLSADNMRALFAGELSAFNAYMTGLLQVEGDLQSARRIEALVAKIQRI